MANEMLIGFGWLSFALLIGAFLRYKITFLQNMLIPSSAIGGIVGFILINIGIIQVPIDLFQTFVADRKSTRLNSSHVAISYAVFCLKKKTTRSNSRDRGELT